MLVMTLTLRETEHQVSLGFKKTETFDAAVKLMKEALGSVRIKDDYDQLAMVLPQDVVAVEMADADRQWEFRNALKLARVRGEQEYQKLLGSDPTLKFLVGDALRMGG